MLYKKMLRDMKEHKMQFISIFLMAFLTLFIYSGVGAEAFGIQHTVDEFYEDTNMADIWIYGDNFNNDTFEKINNISTTIQSERQFVISSTVDVNNNPSLTVHFIESNNLSKYYPIDGSDIDLDDKDGIWLDKRFAQANNLSIGDNITFKFNGLSLEKTIRGLGYSPEYVYEQSEESIVPDFSLQGFGYLSYKAFSLDNLPYNVVLIKTNDSSDNYQEKLDESIKDDYSTMLPFKDHSSVLQFQSEIDQHQLLGSMFPALFVIVTILTLITTLIRIVTHQRTQIGTLKAIGYSNKSLIIHYMSYGFYLTLIGSVLGLIIGVNTLPYLFFPSMSSFYTLPEWIPAYDNSFFMLIIMFVLIVLICAYLATKNVVKESPASALEPKAPKVSGKLIIEKTRLWDKLGFNMRWNIRDIKRNKIRSLVMIVSVIGCTILLISALGMSDGMSDLKTWQYGTINHYENQLNVEDNATTAQINEVLNQVNGTQVMTKAIEVKANNIKKTVNVNSYNKTKLITPTDNHMDPMDISENEVVLTQKTAELLDVHEGDTIYWHMYGDTKWVNSTIDKIIADPTNQGITISPNKLEELDYNFTTTMIVTENDVNDSYEGISSIYTIQDLQNSWDDMMESGNLMIAILLIFAFLLSVVMLYSLGILSFNEVELDLATLKVLGFQSKNIRRMFLTQNLILSIIGFIIGVPLGYKVLRVMMDTSGDTFYYPVHYSPNTIMYTFLIIIGLSLLVNVLLSRKIKDIDMVESLKKTRE